MAIAKTSALLRKASARTIDALQAVIVRVEQPTPLELAAERALITPMES